MIETSPTNHNPHDVSRFSLTLVSTKFWQDNNACSQEASNQFLFIFWILIFSKDKLLRCYQIQIHSQISLDWVSQTCQLLANSLETQFLWNWETLLGFSSVLWSDLFFFQFPFFAGFKALAIHHLKHWLSVFFMFMSAFLLARNFGRGTQELPFNGSYPIVWISSATIQWNVHPLPFIWNFASSSRTYSAKRLHNSFLFVDSRTISFFDRNWCSSTRFWPVLRSVFSIFAF